MIQESELRPEGTIDSNCFQKAKVKIKSLLKNIPLDEYTLKDDILTHELGFWAPKGWAFKITGCFEVGAYTGGDQFDWIDTYPSFALWKLNLLTDPDYKNYRKYFKQLITQGLSKKEAYEEVYEDMDKYYWPEELPQVFEGKIITLPFLKENKAFNPNENLQLLIKKPVVINYTQNCQGVINIPYDGKLKKVLYDSNEANWISWSQMYAQINLINISAKCNITLIKNDKFDQETKLFIPKPKETKLVRPH